MLSERLPTDVTLTEEELQTVEGLDAIIDDLRPSELNMAAIDISRLGANNLQVMLPHTDGETEILITIENPGVVVSFPVDHLHFHPSDPEDGRLWPVEGDDHVDAALTLVRYLLEGRVEAIAKDHRGIEVEFIDDDRHRQPLSRTNRLPPNHQGSWRVPFTQT